MPSCQETEVYRGPEGHIIRSEMDTFTSIKIEFRGITAAESLSRIYASKQSALKWLRKMEAQRQAKLDKLRHSQAVILAKAEQYR
jgi:hypothetical protein